MQPIHPGTIPASPDGLLTSAAWDVASDQKELTASPHAPAPGQASAAVMACAGSKSSAEGALHHFSLQERGTIIQHFSETGYTKAYQEMRGFSLSYFPAEHLNTHLVFTREGKKQAKDFRENKVCFL